MCVCVCVCVCARALVIVRLVVHPLQHAQRQTASTLVVVGCDAGWVIAWDLMNGSIDGWIDDGQTDG